MSDKISNCCGVPPWSSGGVSTEDYEICPNCWEHCEYIDEEDISDEKLRTELENDPEMTKILQEINDIENPAVTGLNDITKKQIL